MEKSKYFKSTVLPTVIFSSLVGILTGLIIFIFRICAHAVISLSGTIYSAVRENPKLLPLLVISAALIGLISAVILKFAKDCRGGGIPTAIASIRGLLPLKWIQGIFFLFTTSMITFLGGVPLGNEGPSVQIGASVGKGTVEFLGGERSVWQRYAMTCGACTGFAIVTGSPIAGIIFAFEEAHKRISSTTLSTTLISVFVGVITHANLCEAFSVEREFLHLTINASLPAKHLYIMLIIGIVAGFSSVLLTKAYNLFRKFDKANLSSIHIAIKFPMIFALTAILGFFSENFIGTGHALIERILSGEILWYSLIAALLIRGIMMIIANCEGVSGGLFVPTLTLGAIISALIADASIFLGIIDTAYYPIMIVAGMAAFLSASSRIPLIALVFAIESLAGIDNVSAIGIAAATAFLVVEFSSAKDFTDTVIEAKIEKAHRGKIPLIVNTYVTVMENSFASGKEVKELLLPPTCTVLSIDTATSPLAQHSSYLAAGDVLHIHYSTYDNLETARLLCDLFGNQDADPRTESHFGSESHTVPID